MASGKQYPTPNVRNFQKKMRKLERAGFVVERPIQLPSLSDASVIKKVRQESAHRRRLERMERFSRENRADLTCAEGRMNAILLELGWRFNCEHPKGKYVLDFYVHQYRLAIEVDGGYHETVEQRARDRQRDRWLVSRGIDVIRFKNEQVIQYPRKTKASLLMKVKPVEVAKNLRRMLPSTALLERREYTAEAHVRRSGF
jgi:very-short-patch-repair endonuclease